MVGELLKWDDLDGRLSNAFMPATAINRKDFFRGRKAYLRRILDTVNEAGKHAVIYGERGVGKTSLANVIAAFLEPYSSEEITSFKVNCNQQSSFDSIWRNFFRDLNIPVPDTFRKITPDDILNQLPPDRKVILIVDEFDRLQDPDIDTMFADTIKALSDFNVDTTLILVGVADDVGDLVAEHASIPRQLAQVHLERMSVMELRDIVDHGMADVGMSISPSATEKICKLSLGLPHYTHALARNAGRAAIDRKSERIVSPDADDAVTMLLNDTEQSCLKQFNLATASPRKENYYFQVLLACALAPVDDLGLFYPQDIREPYSKIRGSEFGIPAFSRHLHHLTTDVRGTVLQRFGQSHGYRFRFADPQMQPFVLMQGIQRGTIDLDTLPSREPQQGRLPLQEL